MKNVFIGFFILCVLGFLGLPLGKLLAQMQSTGYKIQSDSVNIGGGASSSTNYNMNDTVGEVGSGESNSGTYFMHAGFQQMQETYIAISSPSDLALANIGGLTGGASEGTVSWTVTTDNPAGYTLTISADTSPALRSIADSFADYAPASADPDYTFAVATSASAFGFSPEGTDIASRYKDNGIACNSGSGDTVGKCWDGLSTTSKTAMNRASGNQPSGSVATVRFRAEVGSARVQTSGTYSATISVTATTL